MTLSKAPIQSDLDPLGYPWNPPEVNGLMTPEGYLPMDIAEGRRLGKARVLLPESYYTKGLNSYLAEHSQAPMSARHVVLAVGSNASPAVMANKFRRRGYNTPMILPFVRCNVANLGVGFYPFVPPRGYIPATPFDAPGTRIQLWASWLDRDQLAALDSTEPGYSCLRLSSKDYPLFIDNPHDDHWLGGEELNDYYIYYAKDGVIQLPDSDDPLRLCSQHELYRRLAGTEEFGSDFDHDDAEVLAWLQNERTGRDFVTRLGQAGMIVQRPLKGIDESNEAQRVTYRSCTGFRAPSGIDAAMRIQPSRDDLERKGETYIVVSPQRAAEAGLGSHALVRAVPYLSTGLPGVVGKVIKRSDVASDEIEMDQLLRDGLGLEVQEWVTIEPAKVPRRTLLDGLVGRRYAEVRVQSAEHSHGETDLTLLSPVTMAYLGLRDGDHVVYEGMPGPDGKVGIARMRAAAIPPEVEARREQLREGGLDALYASPESALGVYPDLPMALLDAATRTKLNLGSHRLAAVRVRPSRRHKLISEFREGILVLAIAVLGLVTISNSVLVAVISVVVILLLILWAGCDRVR